MSAGTAVVIALCLTSGFVTSKVKAKIPVKHLQGHPVHYQEAFIPAAIADELMAHMKTVDFPTNAADLSFYKTRHEHIGEAQPAVNGTCAHPFLIPSQDRTLCVLPGRVDVARAYVMSGGVEGLKESPAKLVSRVQSFGRYYFDLEQLPPARALFDMPAFSELAAAVCPPDATVLDPIQANLIVNIPGQTVASHIDAPYFWGADRFTLPQWLLAVMVHSGLFADRFIHQVQVVGYVHRWEDPTGARAGEFVYYDDASGVPKSVPPAPLSASSVDGSKVVHASRVYMPERAPPPLNKDKANVLRYAAGSDMWELTSGGEVVATYPTDELRFSVVYRARCFASEEKRAAFAAQRRGNPADPADTGDMLPLETVLNTLKEGLVTAGAYSRVYLNSLSPLALAELLLDSYIRYPLSHTSAFPLNVCAAKLVAPTWMAPAFDAVC